jgi:hypothetical protein
VRHVEPLEMVLAHQEPVDVLKLVIIQPQSLEHRTNWIFYTHIAVTKLFIDH